MLGGRTRCESQSKPIGHRSRVLCGRRRGEHRCGQKRRHRVCPVGAGQTRWRAGDYEQALTSRVHGTHGGARTHPCGLETCNVRLLTVKKLKTIVHKLKWLIAILLIASGPITAYVWHYRLAPLRNLADVKWKRAHSESGKWTEEQAKYRRTNSSPDLFFFNDTIGYYGNEEWVHWLMNNVESKAGFRVCGCTEEVLAHMTNHSFTNFSMWSDWYEKNKSLSQEQWIKDGFAHYGAAVSIPPETNDVEPLLLILGNSDTNANLRIPSSVRYNAFRWLRDSNFEPVNYLLSHSNINVSGQLARGVKKYSDWYHAFPRRGAQGVLFDADKKAGKDLDEAPIITTVQIKMFANALIIGCPAIGLMLLFYRNKNSELIHT